MHADAGDRIEVTNNTLGAPPRHGEVLARSGSTGLRVRWDDGRESVFVPSSNCRVVEPGEARNDPVRLACHIDVDVVDDDDECRATATFVTSRGQLEAHGVARRNPVDPQVPVVGEELAIGRALAALATQLIEGADADLAHPPADHAHLVN